MAQQSPPKPGMEAYKAKPVAYRKPAPIGKKDEKTRQKVTKND